MAAGLGFKTFTTGEVLTAADTNGYLMQGINVFASTAARDAAITSPQEGQFAFTKDTNGLWYYDGAAWVASGATGDIEGVTAGIGISGGGTSGTVTVTNSMATAIDAKGDLVVGTAADTFSRLGVGANNTVLTADSAEATGLKWATPATAASGMTFISKTAFTGQTTVSINSCFTSTYANYFIVFDAVNTGAVAADLSFRLRASGTDTTANYKSQRIYGTVTTVGGGVDILGTDEIWFASSPQSGNPPLGTSFILMSPNEAKRTVMQGSMAYGLFTSGNPIIDIVSGSQSDTTQFDGITFIFGASNTGNIYIYGLQKA